MAFPFLAAATVGAGLLGFKGQRDANKEQTNAAQKQMDFQERMSNTAYERAMADMRKSGLNPMLANQKGGASTPSGAQPNIKNVFEGAPSTAANLIAAKTAEANIDNVNAQTQLTTEKANTEKLTQTQIAANTASQVAQTDQTRAQIQNILKQGGILDSNATVASTEAFLSQIDRMIYETPAYQWKRNLEKMGLTGNALRKALPALARRFPALGVLLGAGGTFTTK